MSDSGRVFPDDALRIAGYANYSAFFDGSQWSSRGQRGETRLTVNYARALLRKVASYVFSGPVRFAVISDIPNDPLAARAELALTTTGRENDLDALDPELCLMASVLGDAAIKVTWDATRARPVIAAVHPGGLHVTVAPDNPRQLTAVTHVYHLQPAQAQTLFGALPAAIRSERPLRIQETWTDTNWQVAIEQTVVRAEANPYGWIPYVFATNNARADQFWGESDLVDLIDLCRELNSRMSVLSRVLEFSGAPIAVLENVEGADTIRVGPGAMWEIPEGSKAYLLDLLQGGGVRLHIDYIELLYRALHDLSETPRTAFGDSGRPLSGAALEVEIQPLVQKVRRKRQAWERMHRARNLRILDLLERFGGIDLGGLRATETIWPSVLPSDIDGSVRNAVALVQSGIQSRRTAWAALGGLDPDAELMRIREEAKTE
ncbi:MAG TPA: phage portal protein [Thermomicrobiales bacterium]|nr:phage portal protein [Thermomicrobiales bacterium]